MATDYISLLNLTYEIEGLVLLHINRGEEASPEMAALLEDKIKRIASFLPIHLSAPVPAVESRAIPTPDQETIAQTVIEEETEDACPGKNTPDQEAIAQSAIEEETGDACPGKNIPDQEAIAQSAIEEETGDANKMNSVEFIDPAKDAVKHQDLISRKEEALRLEDKLARDRARDIFKAFTINDKFRFRRELFRNSQEEFDDTLYVIAQMTDFVEAEEYFYSDLCWDPENEDVKEFMEIVKKHF